MHRFSNEGAQEIARASIAAIRGSQDSHDLKLASRAMEVALEVGPWPSSRKSDFRAPSVWHAACYLLTLWQGWRTSAQPLVPSEELVNTFFGNSPLFRGQAHPWPITPKLWRSDHNDVRNFGPHPIEAFRKVLAYWAETSRDVSFELFGKLASLEGATAAAQHYDFPTNYVDFSFNPLVALHFAVGNCPITELIPETPPHHGVVYIIPFVKLAHVAQLTGSKSIFHFPPVQVSRLYRQAGCFADFGSMPEDLSQLRATAEAPWMWTELNCRRLFFPREYPAASDVQVLRNSDLEVGEPFFLNSLEALRGYCLSCGQFVEEEARSHMTLWAASRPPWVLEDDIEAVVVTDTYLKEVGFHLASYLNVAASIKMAGKQHLDPALICYFANSHSAAFRALFDLSRVGGECMELEPTVTLVRQALEMGVKLGFS
jgi:hypothetical protein